MRAARLVMRRPVRRAALAPMRVMRARMSAVPRSEVRQASFMATVAGVAVGGALVGMFFSPSDDATSSAFARSGAKGGAVDYDAVRAEIAALIEEDDNRGPTLVRLAWHSSGTYDASTGKYGSGGGTIRLKPESGHGANAGLTKAMAWLEPIKRRHPGISYADLYTLAGVVAVETMAGPEVSWRPGRVDKTSSDDCAPEGNLPDAAQGSSHVRDIFYRMGFNDREIVALAGAHSLGRCHRDRSGYDGPWTRAPTTFSNLYFTELMERKWRLRKWDGPAQYEDETGDLMMLPADMALKNDPSFSKYVQLYARDAEAFERDFAAAFAKLISLGVKDQ